MTLYTTSPHDGFCHCTECRPPIPVGTRVHVSDNHYAGPAIVLEYDAAIPQGWPASERLPYYCHLLGICTHGHEVCKLGDACIGEACRGWYAIQSGDRQ